MNSPFTRLFSAIVASVLLSLPAWPSAAAADAPVVKLWPGTPPGETAKLPPEGDIYKPTDDKIAGRPIIKLANVSTPTLTIYKPPTEKDTGAAVIVCPGGGHYILAYDLEGTEVAEWLNSIGVTAVLLKYRVPARDREKEPRWRAAVQDAQRAVGMVRSQAKEWGVDPKRIGLCGFSAGGETAGLTATFGTRRTYAAVDAHDKISCRPDFAILIYPAGFAKGDSLELEEHVKVDEQTPPMFFAHAYDDPVTPRHSLALFAALKKAGVPAELHVYATGGHGYGLRATDDAVTKWPEPCTVWLRSSGWLKKRQE